MPDAPPNHEPTHEATVLAGEPGAAGTVTAVAPPYCAPAAPAAAGPRHLLGLPAPGQRLHDFELLAVLGAGSFAKVYLAREVSLGRHVALKVSLNAGQEARTLASLEHDHIVRVFSEVVDAPRNLRLLCMQYVPGTTLEHVIEALGRRPREEWSGQAVLDAVDALATQPAALDVAALRDRELLAECDFVEAACWLGARLAEALAHAHGLGVLHRDIKPANVLINRYGRPLLADFNVAQAAPRDGGPAGDQPFGGTLAYMAPEHLDAFNPEHPTSAAAVDARSDVYALGVVLYELFTGRLPFAPPEQTGGVGAFLRELAAQRRAGPPPTADVPPAVGYVLRRCLDPDPTRRYPSAGELAAALEGCRQLRAAERGLPPGGVLTRLALARPFLTAAVLMLLPHFLGTAVNVTYNFLRIVERLTEAQWDAFFRILFVYNAIVYPVCLFLLFRQSAPAFAADWRPGGADEARRRALRLPLWAAGLSCLGWLPGGLLFPLGLHALAGPVPLPVFGHFLVSFAVSGLIALTYSVFGVLFVVVRVLYPRLWADAREARRKARAELAWVDGLLGLLQFLAVLIPLAGAALLLGGGPEEIHLASYRALVAGLLALGTVGLGVALLVSAQLRRTLTVLTGARAAATGVAAPSSRR